MTLLPVHVDGRDLKTSDGKVFKAIGSAEFALFKRFLMRDGWNALVKPILDERRNLAVSAGYAGPLVARVFRHGGPWNVFGITDPWSYSMAQVTEFTQRLGNEGWYVDWTGGDAQVCFPSPDPNRGEMNGPRGINQHNNEFCAAIAGCPNALIFESQNEAYKNGVDVGQVKPPKWGSYVRASGYYSESDWDHSIDLDVIDFHPDRSDDMNHTVPKFVGKLFESAVYLKPLNKPIIYAEPIGADESNIPGKRCNDPGCWGEMGYSVGLVAGVYFHSTPGLASDGFGPTVKECFKAFCRTAGAVARVS